MLRKLGSNAYLIKLPPELQINSIFNVLDLYLFEEFIDTPPTIKAQVSQLTLTKVNVVQEVLDVKEVRSRRGNLYRQILVKWLGKLENDSTWITEAELK